MKKAAMFILMGAVLLVAVVAGWLGWSVKQEQPKSSVEKAREGKAKLKDLRDEAEGLGINHFGLSANDLEKEIEVFKANQDVKDNNETDSTKEEAEPN